MSLSHPQENPNSWAFLEPVEETQAPEYYKIIKLPMGELSSDEENSIPFIYVPTSPRPLYRWLDLQSVSERLRSGYYSCLRLFLADMRRIFNNCKTFNERNTDYYRSAISLEKFYVSKMKEAGIWMELTWAATNTNILLFFKFPIIILLFFSSHYNFIILLFYEINACGLYSLLNQIISYWMLLICCGCTRYHDSSIYASLVPSAKRNHEKAGYLIYSTWHCTFMHPLFSYQQATNAWI